MSKKRYDLRLIIPAFNESRDTLDNIYQKLAGLDTGASLKKVMITFVIRDANDVIQNWAKNIEKTGIEFIFTDLAGRGLGIQLGAKTDADYYAYIDADDSIESKNLVNLLEAVTEEGYDIGIGSKRHPSSLIERPLKRRILSYGFNSLVRLILQVPYSDTQGGMKAWNHRTNELLRKLTSKHWFLDTEFVVTASWSGLRIKECPIVVKDIRKDTKVNVKRDIFAMFSEIIKLRIRKKRVMKQLNQ